MISLWFITLLLNILLFGNKSFLTCPCFLDAGHHRLVLRDQKIGEPGMFAIGVPVCEMNESLERLFRLSVILDCNTVLVTRKHSKTLPLTMLAILSSEAIYIIWLIPCRQGF